MRLLPLPTTLMNSSLPSLVAVVYRYATSSHYLHCLCLSLRRCFPQHTFSINHFHTATTYTSPYARQHCSSQYFPLPTASASPIRCLFWLTPRPVSSCLGSLTHSTLRPVYCLFATHQHQTCRRAFCGVNACIAPPRRRAACSSAGRQW